MRKDLESTDPKSCWNRARPDQFVFVLLDHDVTTPGTIRDWVNRRIKAGKNKDVNDPQIAEALALADQIEKEQRAQALKKAWPHNTTVEQACEIVRRILDVEKVDYVVDYYLNGRAEVRIWIMGHESPNAIQWNATFDLPPASHQVTEKELLISIPRSSMDLLTLINFVCDNGGEVSIPFGAVEHIMRDRDLGALYAAAWRIVSQRIGNEVSGNGGI